MTSAMWPEALPPWAASAFLAMSRLSAPSPAAGSRAPLSLSATPSSEAFYRNMVVGHGPYCEEGEGGEGEGEGGGGECEGYGGEGMEGERKSKGERGQGTGRWHTRGGRVVGGDRRIPSYGGEYRYAREDKDVGVQLLLSSRSVGSGRGSARSSGRRRTRCRTS